ncbi:MAG: hypothetical protein L6R38_005649 [Xanthoria sp. 2 TBL-2021]|nr:MAG: hypothetical protein L6R38_005649 [Xanthoria sp. 2 TBL-2021]
MVGTPFHDMVFQNLPIFLPERCIDDSQSQSVVDPSLIHGPQLYEVVDIPGKGRSLVAGVNIVRGQRILCEQPLFTCSLNWTAYKDFETHLTSTIASLPTKFQETFFALHNANPGKEYPLVARFLTNCIPCQDRTEAAVYATACLINHSCQANAYGHWNFEARVETVHATQDIQAGAEILFDYVSGQTCEIRQEKLKRLWGISCSCVLCSLPVDEIQKSDASRRRIETLFDESGNMQSVIDQPEQCLEKCGQLMKLIQDEYGGGSQHLIMSAQATDSAYRICTTHSDLASAGVLQERSYGLRLLCEGSDSPLVKQMKSAIEYKHQETPIDAMRSFCKWYSKRGDEPRLLKYMEMRNN